MALDHRAAPRARWLRKLTGLLLLAGAGLVVFAATPEVLRAAGVLGPRPVKMPLASERPREILEDDPPIQRGFVFDPSDDDERDEPEGPPGLPGVHGLPGVPPPPGAPEPGDVRLATAVAKVVLRDKPAPSGVALGQLARGDVVRVVREDGDYALVLKSDDDEVAMGWARRADLSVR